MLNTLIFLKRVLRGCENKPVIVVDRGPWYPLALKRLDRWIRKLKERTKRFYSNINTKSIKNVEEKNESNNTINHTEQSPRRGILT